MRLADSGRRTQAMNLEGRRSGSSSEWDERDGATELGGPWALYGLEVPERESRPSDVEGSSERLERIPERMAIPMVPTARSADVLEAERRKSRLQLGTHRIPERSKSSPRPHWRSSCLS